MKISAASGKEQIQIALLLWLVTLWQASAANENAAAFKALCRMYRTLNAKLTEADAAQADVTAEIKQIENLKISSLHTQNYTNATFGDYKEPTKWAQRKKEIENNEAPSDEGEYKRYPDSKAKQAAHTRIILIEKKAKALHARVNALNRELKGAIEETNNQLNAALFGGNKSSDADEAPFAERADACTKEGGNVGKSLASDAACVCASTAANNVCCQGCAADDYANAATNTASDAKKVWLRVKNKCDKLGKNNKPTAAALQAALDAVVQTIGGRSTNEGAPYMLGGDGAGTCDGSTDYKQACVDYSKRLGRGELTQIPWIKNVIGAIETLRKAASDTVELKRTEEAIKHLTALAWTAYDLIPPDGQQSKEPETAAMPAAATTDSRKEEECNKHQSQSDCKDPCKWNESERDTNKKCSLDNKKPAEEANQETGGKDGKTTNTTGSNSFLINKAPLLLALLLS